MRYADMEKEKKYHTCSSLILPGFFLSVRCKIIKKPTLKIICTMVDIEAASPIRKRDTGIILLIAQDTGRLQTILTTIPSIQHPAEIAVFQVLQVDKEIAHTHVAPHNIVNPI